MSMAEPCLTCGDPVREADRVVLVRGRRQQLFCSDSCLRAHVDRRRAVRNRALLRAAMIVVLPTAAFVAVKTMLTRHRAPPRQTISLAWSEGLPEWSVPPLPVFFGPPWPPTDEQWTAVFDQANWTFPLPGPARRPLTADDRVLGPEPPREHPARCRDEEVCGVDLGGDLWGEHVHAAMDGVVERVQGEGNDRRGGHYVRLSHFGGMVFTQYFHLAASPRRLGRGAHVKAGDVIGLVGDTGLGAARGHLHFALSVRPSPSFSEVYWDPTPWLTPATMSVPTHGTVAGFVP
jgi:hypothetical protein